MAAVVITGCGLVFEFGSHHWGDLWEEGDCWIFNACGSEEGLSEPLTGTEKILYVSGDRNYFQRRNVFVIHKLAAELNQAAKDYLK
jgi:hypothetical protein